MFAFHQEHILKAWFVSDMVGNPDDLFSYDAAHFCSFFFRLIVNLFIV